MFIVLCLLMCTSLLKQCARPDCINWLKIRLYLSGDPELFLKNWAVLKETDDKANTH